MFVENIFKYRFSWMVIKKHDLAMNYLQYTHSKPTDINRLKDKWWKNIFDVNSTLYINKTVHYEEDITIINILVMHK